ncbi:hypothetical protein Leryth_021670 [Lithospermum erythrorhizon]|nr:hypothetical protein Leryth_021670 [Lithospermum erythrorhizon]
MRMNKLEGTIPTNISSMRLTTLNLHGNHLRGNIPSSLATCVTLKVLDLGNNNLNAPFPSWLGVLPDLTVLSLRSNKFHGKIRLSTTSSFPKLKMLDLSHNQFIGTLPPMLFQSFSSMMEIHKTTKKAFYMGDIFYMDSTTLFNKGIQVELDKIITTWVAIDLSSNNFEGNIPNSLGMLSSVRQLNFSNNRFIELATLPFISKQPSSTTSHRWVADELYLILPPFGARVWTLCIGPSYMTRVEGKRFLNSKQF